MKDNWLTVLMIVGALAAGSAAAYFADGYIDKTIDSHRAALDSEYQHVRVVVARANLHAGTSLSSDTAAIREVPRAFLHSEAVLADQWDSVAGRVLAHTINSGEVVLLSHLTQDAKAGFASQLAPGMRALTLPVDDQSSLSGMLAPGDHIDIFFTTLSGNESITLPLLLDVPVIATGIRTVANAAYLDDKRQSQYSNVTVSVSPDDAARITLAQDVGKMTMVLRRSNEDQSTRIDRISKRTLLSGEGVAKVRQRRLPVEIILGEVSR